MTQTADNGMSPLAAAVAARPSVPQNVKDVAAVLEDQAATLALFKLAASQAVTWTRKGRAIGKHWQDAYDVLAARWDTPRELLAAETPFKMIAAELGAIQAATSRMNMKAAIDCVAALAIASVCFWIVQRAARRRYCAAIGADETEQDADG